ncbi:MAG: efflux RND transporter permease subunit [Thiogranum sp.]
MASTEPAGFLCWKRIPDLISRHTLPILLIVASITVLALVQIVDVTSGRIQIQIDPSAERLLAADDEANVFYETTRRVFGNDETVLLLLQAEDVFSARNLELIARLTHRLERLDGVIRVVSLGNALAIRGTEYGIDIESYAELAADTAQGRRQFRDAILANPMYSGSLVSRDARATAILISLADIGGYAFFSQIDKSVKQIIDEEAREASIWVTGTPLLTLATTNALLDDLIKIPLIVILVMAVVLAFCFRCLKGVLVPLSSVAISVLWTLATIAALDYSLNIVTVLVPSLLMILSLSYSIHVVSEFLEAAGESGDRQSLASAALRRVFLPVVLTGLTTATGFLSLTLSPLAAIREFGVFSVIGVSYAVLVTLTYTPSILKLIHCKPQAASRAGKQQSGWFDRFAQSVAQFDISYRRPIFVAFALTFILALAGMSEIRVGMEHITNFRQDSPVRRAYEEANAQLGGANLFYIVIDTGHRDAVKEPVNLKAIKELQLWLAAQTEIGGSLSIVDYLQLLNRAFHDNKPEYHLIPDTRKEIGQLLFFGASDEVEKLVDSRYQLANVVVRSKAVDSGDLAALVEKVNDRLAHFPQHLSARVTGNPVLINDVLDEIIRGQVRSVFAALLIVYGVLVGLFLSFRIGLIALIPNILPVVVYFGVLGFLGISLNPSNSMIAPMVLGIAIDDTVHYFARFNEFMKQQSSARQATISSLRVVGRPVTYTSIALCLGFLVLTTSDLRMQAEVGAMACFALAFAWLSDFLLTPALCSQLRIATIWDALTLDLGKKPQETIPLFKGLSNFQARIVARMASIRVVSAGERIIAIGQPGLEMYAVIDGKLQASIEGKSGRIDLDAHTRGDIVGEAGLFFAKRTANVDAIEDTRLLRITLQDLETLRRRYPRIAARVFRNLNEILATRLVHATERLG